MMIGNQLLARSGLRQTFYRNTSRAVFSPVSTCRLFSSRGKKREENPFKILGIRESADYAAAKRSFLQIAMKNHPDTSNVENESEKEKMRDIFMKARKAFEKLVEAPDGSVLLKEEADKMPDFDSWFQQETGLKNPFDIDLDPATIKEIAEMTEEMGGGLARDGGMWQLAKMVTDSAQQGGDAASILKLEGGQYEAKDRRIDGELRRRRKR
mmetsp:Transcript_27946/g.41267  ORF Transcript_27946/g.41267 Transcript_27946/m.41267 type:complete len:211 (+) Transcript_27946:76-708(+)